ncbi:MAG: helix-turn-helix transcriptional regulator [Acidimicrobiia bacterium]|nr:helix-turn-helix transcriptional regulator [Acidimicrobiia bacterium]
MVHLKVVPDDRRERSREKKRQRFLDAASAIVDREGLRGVTMAAVADELDCAVGTIYSYFSSKAALLTALQGQAVDLLAASFATARERWEDQLAGEELPDEVRTLVEVLGFGSFWSAASVVFADEFELQRQLLSAKVTLVSAEEIAEVMPVARRLLDGPAGLVEAAVAAGALADGPAEARVLRWVCALNGVLLVENLAPLDRHLFRASHLARCLTEDLLVGWGAERRTVEVAAAHVDRLAAGGPMAPPPEGPGWDR